MARRSLFSRQPKSLIASGAKISLNNSEAIKQTLSLRTEWQTQAWEAFDAVGQIKYGISTLANLIARVQLFIAEVPDKKNEEPTISDHSGANETLDRLGNVVTISDLLADLAMNMLVVGECYLVCVGPRNDDDPKDSGREEEEQWLVRSIDEVRFENNAVSISSPSTSEAIQKWIKLDEERGDTFIRVWRQHPRKHHLADSHIRGVLDAAEELLWWQAASRARAKSRLSDSGIVALPSDMELPSETTEDEHLTGAERTAKKMMDTYVQTVQNPGTAGAVAPIVTTYPANEQRKSGIEHITVDRPQDALIKERVERCLLDIEQGINLPAGVISGLGNATHWGGGQIEESTFRDHVEPGVLLVCSALTKAFLHPILEELGADISKLIIWYDASNLITHPDAPTQSNRGLELTAITFAAWRRTNGYSETDAPDEKEREEIVKVLQAIRSSQHQGIVENPQKPNDPRNPNAPPREPRQVGKERPVDQPAAPLRRRGQSPLAAAGFNGLSDTALSIQVMADEKVRRALEKAGNKLRSRARKVPAYSTAIKGKPPEEVARTLGREAVLKLGPEDLFDGCFDNLEDRLLFFCPPIDGFSPVATVSKAADFLRARLKELAAEALFTTPSEQFLVPLSIVGEVLELAKET